MLAPIQHRDVHITRLVKQPAPGAAWRWTAVAAVLLAAVLVPFAVWAESLERIAAAAPKRLKKDGYNVSIVQNPTTSLADDGGQDDSTRRATRDVEAR